MRRFAATTQSLCERILSKDLPWAVLVVVLLTPMVSQQQCTAPGREYRAGEVALSTLKAPSDIELPDERATLERREAERLRVPPVYDLVVSVADQQAGRLAGALERGRQALRASEPFAPSGRTGGLPAPDTLARVGAAMGHPAPPEAVAVLVVDGFSENLERVLLKIHSAVMQGRIAGSKEGLPETGSVTVRELTAGAAVEVELSRMALIRDLAEARGELRARLEAALSAWPEHQRRSLAMLLDGYLAPNLSYNASETEKRRAYAVKLVPQVFTRIPRGRVIVREGEVFTEEALETLARIRSAQASAVDWKALAGHAVVLSLLALFLHRYVRAHQRIFRRVKNLYTLTLLVIFTVTVGAWVGLFIADAVADRLRTAPFDDPATYRWALPVSAGAMLVTLLANGRVATVCSAVVAVLFGMVLGWDARAMVFALISSFAAIHGITKYERRATILKACAWVALFNAAVALALTWVGSGLGPPGRMLLPMACAAAGGILVAPVVTFSLPILEWLFNVLTDFRLLELSNLENPLLRRLAMEAPGTYNHSIIVGTLAEQAAEEIGAHALLCRVAAYYHDVGKMAKPEYFVENMREGENRHDRLSPRMSSLIIASHVKEGMRLAEEYNLPRQIRDIIPQHHGTRLITYFYRKAKRKEDPDVPEIHESDYRYPGPLPQTREAAIFMMADSVEAAARTVEEPTPAMFEEVIDKVSNAIVLDHQLDECDLTFSDLGKIRASFLKTLTAVHHHRVSYPGFEFDRSRPRVVEAD